MAKSQKVVIKIGYQQIMLPDDVGAATVIKALSRGVAVSHYGNSVRLEKEKNLEISLSYLPHNTEFTDENDRPILPEKKGRQPLALKAPPLLALMGGDE